MLTIVQLYWSFLKIGFTSFGGLSMIPLINSEMGVHGWMTAAEISDIVAIAEITPGPLGLNCATFAGMRIAGIFGALVANFGILTPTFTVGAAAAICFEKFKNGSFLKSIMIGVRPAGIGLIWGTILNLARTNYITEGTLFLGYDIKWISVFIGAVGVYLLIWKKLSIPKTIGIAAVLGVALGTLFGV